MFNMAPYAFLTKNVTLINWLPAFVTQHPENDQDHCMTFLRTFGRRIRLNNIGVEAVEESAALQDNFPETEGPSQLPLSYTTWYPTKQMFNKQFLN
jgi:hypothetical protein